MSEDKIHEDFSQATIGFCPNQEQLPWFTGLRDLPRDQSLSVLCRLLIVYLWTNSDTWNIRMSQLINDFKPHAGKNKMYAAMNEAIQAGYIRREIILEGNLKKKVKYFISRTGKFKKSFRLPDFGDPEKKDPEDRDIKERTIDKNKQKKEEELGSAPPASVRLARFFFDTLREVNPKQREPNLVRWAKDFDRMMRVDKRTEEEVMQVIKHMIFLHKLPSKGFFNWFTWIQSPDKLREKFDKLTVDMNTKKSSQVNSPEEDKKLIAKVKEKIPKHSQITYGDRYIEFSNGMHSVPTICTIGDRNFRFNVIEQLRKRKLSMEGL